MGVVCFQFCMAGGINMEADRLRRMDDWRYGLVLYTLGKMVLTRIASWVGGLDRKDCLASGGDRLEGLTGNFIFLHGLVHNGGSFL